MSPHYEIATFDTGATATLIGSQAFAGFDIAGAGRSGTNVTQIGGVVALTDAINSDPLGVYAAGFGAISSTEPWQVDRSQLRGRHSASIIYAQPGDFLPNLLGTPVSTQYTTTIDYGQPQIITTASGRKHRSPSVELHELGTVAAPTRRLGMRLEPGPLGPLPTFLPDLVNFDINDLSNNPSTPTVAGWFFLESTISHQGEIPRESFDAAGHWFSRHVCLRGSCRNIGVRRRDDAPDFAVRLEGVTGTFSEVPGFLADEFKLPGTDGGLVLNNVPLIVFNFPYLRDGTNTLPGLLGMNVFANRNVILNPEGGNAYLGVSDPSLESHRWVGTGETGKWTDFTNWNQIGIPEANWDVTVANVTGNPQRVELSADSRVAGINVAGKGAAGAMSVRIENNATLEVFGTAIIAAGGSIDVAEGTLDTLAVEVRGGAISGNGIVVGEVISQGHIVPGGTQRIGIITFDGSFDQLQQGTIAVEIRVSDNSDAANLQYDQIDVVLDSSIAGTLEIDALEGYSDPIEPGTWDDFTILAATNLFGKFDTVKYNGNEMQRQFLLFGDDQSFREHAGDGLFRFVSYVNDEVHLTNYRTIPGDADGSGDVQFDDFVLLSENFGQPGTWTEGDFDGDGLVQFGDFVDLAESFGEFVFSPFSASTAAAVPEPSTGWLLLGGADFRWASSTSCRCSDSLTSTNRPA